MKLPIYLLFQGQRSPSNQQSYGPPTIMQGQWRARTTPTRLPLPHSCVEYALNIIAILNMRPTLSRAERALDMHACSKQY